MPTYEYLCKNCNYRFEELQSMKDEPLVHCPQCNTDSLARVMGAGSGVIFKGSGFYLTDYRKPNTSAGKKEGKTKSEGTSESKPASPPSSTDSSGSDSSEKKSS